MKGRVEAGPNCLRSFKHRLLCGGFVWQLLDLVEKKRVRSGLKLFFAIFYHDGVMNIVGDSSEIGVVGEQSAGSSSFVVVSPKLCLYLELSYWDHNVH